MSNILWVDACVRPQSRTRRLAAHLIAQLPGEVTTLSLVNEALTPLNHERLAERDAALAAGDLQHPILRYARQFAQADTLVISAPYWDLSFPTLLKNYMELVTATGVTFAYSNTGRPYGLCKAQRLFYVTTAGGPVMTHEYGYGYIQALCRAFYGIEQTHCIAAEGLDIVGADAEKILQEAQQTIAPLLQQAGLMR